MPISEAENFSEEHRWSRVPWCFYNSRNHVECCASWSSSSLMWVQHADNNSHSLSRFDGQGSCTPPEGSRTRQERRAVLVRSSSWISRFCTHPASPYGVPAGTIFARWFCERLPHGARTEECAYKSTWHAWMIRHVFNVGYLARHATARAAKVL